MSETQAELAKYSTDHDLLVVLNERVGSLKLAVENRAMDHEGRIRAIEARQWVFAGGATAISTLAGYLISIFF